MGPLFGHPRIVRSLGAGAIQQLGRPQSRHFIPSDYAR
jgi:hypothetical protein